MKRRRIHRRSKWAHCNSPEALRRRRAKLDARREELAALLPSADYGPEPGDHIATVVILVGSDAHEAHRLVLTAPSSGRCERNRAEIDSVPVPGGMTATEVARWLREALPRRPSRNAIAEAQAIWRQGASELPPAAPVR